MTPSPPKAHHRHSIRLRTWDYASGGAYFVTVVTHDGQLWFACDPYRDIIEEEWSNLSVRFPTVTVGEHVVMPNHVHFILWIDPPQSRVVTLRQDASKERASLHPTLGDVVRAFKAASCRLIRANGGDGFRWLRNYYERVIRNDQELAIIRRYIRENPARWAEDVENPDRASVSTSH